MPAVIEALLGKLSKSFYVCYDVLQANGGDKDGGQMIIPVENRTCPSGLEERGLAVLVTVGGFFSGLRKTQGAAAQPHGQGYEPHNHWVPFRATQ